MSDFSDKKIPGSGRSFSVNPKKQEDIRFVSSGIPAIKDEEVLIKIIRAGLDGTDHEIVKGRYGKSPRGKKRLVIGHEALGEVIRTGKKVSSLDPGDLVVPTVRRPDDCINCSVGEYDMCLKGEYKERGIKKQDGFLSEYFKEDKKFLIKIPKNLKDVAVLLEPASIAEKAVRRAYSANRNFLWNPKTALVTGSGTLGMLTAMLLRIKGLEVTVIDLSEDRHKAKLFKKLKIRYLNAKKTELHDIPKKIGKQLDMIFEETGDSSVALHSISVIGRNGVVVLLSITSGNKKIKICSDCLNQGLVLGNSTVIGSVSSSIQDFKKAIKDFKTAETVWPGFLKDLITARFNFKDTEKAIMAMKDNIKVVVEF